MWPWYSAVSCGRSALASCPVNVIVYTLFAATSDCGATVTLSAPNMVEAVNAAWMLAASVAGLELQAIGAVVRLPP